LRDQGNCNAAKRQQWHNRKGGTTTGLGRVAIMAAIIKLHEPDQGADGVDLGDANFASILDKHCAVLHWS
jgi:hypothetical protein